ncbi:transglutaminase-like domain-containing protein [Methanotorris igneus]|uniref:transglutaminase-like domain-containing protein n=1 Tax=Methanotorris igneus TaxID=2189 RepID=UPI00064F30BB|nr:transglutaminase-like domain-containing protein [Methanotorris igneus]
MSDILNYRLSVCRDYAKLTAALLLNLYPENKIYFFEFFGYLGHVATGIEINGKTYILDQKLPILDEQAWLIKQNIKEATKLILMERNGEFFVEKVGEIKRKKDKSSNIKFKLKNIIPELVEVISKAMKENKKTVSFKLENWGKIYNIEDQLIKESLIRFFKLHLSNELVSNFSKIKDINIIKQGDNLVLKVELKGVKYLVGLDG